MSHMEEYESCPMGHSMSGRSTEEDVDYNDCYEDSHDIENEGEKKISERREERRREEETHLAIRGMVEEVGGRILETRRRKTTIERSTEIVRVIFSPAMGTIELSLPALVCSPESVGRKNTAILRRAIRMVGMMRTVV